MLSVLHTDHSAGSGIKRRTEPKRRWSLFLGRGPKTIEFCARRPQKSDHAGGNLPYQDFGYWPTWFGGENVAK